MWEVGWELPEDDAEFVVEWFDAGGELVEEACDVLEFFVMSDHLAAFEGKDET